MTLDELVVVLHSTYGVGSATLATLLRVMAIHQVGPDDVQQATPSEIEANFGLSRVQACRIHAALTGQSRGAADVLVRLQRIQASVLTCHDAAYPASLLRWLRDPPSVLYAHGDVTLLEKPLIAVANSNGTPSELSALTVQAVELALDLGYVLITGHNRPEYQQPALFARRHGKPVCYVLDRGLLTVIENRPHEPPFSTARIWPSVDGMRDLILSSAAPLFPGAAGSNRWRDRLVMALAQCIVTAHIRHGGNMVRLLSEAAGAGKRIAWLGSPNDMPAALRERENVFMLQPGQASLDAWLEEAVCAD